jgi:Fe2+ or Zn2+ uptake regulation protein
MQTAIRTIEIKDDLKKQMILEIISDSYCRRILCATTAKYCSVQTISEEENIPLSTVYRRLHRLINEKILSVSGTIADNGKKNFFYKSKIKRILIENEDGKLKIEIVPNFTHDHLSRI